MDSLRLKGEGSVQVKNYKKVSADKNKTYFNITHMEHLAGRVASYYADNDKEQRKEQQLCKYCFYNEAGSLAGQAFTSTNCSCCDKEMVFPTTATDTFCKDCAYKIRACKHCGAEMD